MVLHSGGKSLHAWFRMRDLRESKFDRLLRELAGLFDTGALNRASALPAAQWMEEFGPGEPLVKQEVILFDHEAISGH